MKLAIEVIDLQVILGDQWDPVDQTGRQYPEWGKKVKKCDENKHEKVLHSLDRKQFKTPAAVFTYAVSFGTR